jgi:hypothetical protein
VEQPPLSQQQQQQQQQQPVTSAPALAATAVDRQMKPARFAMLNVLCITVLVFSFVKVSQARDAGGFEKQGQVVDAENQYLPVIMAIHGFYMPPPGRKKNTGV